MLHFEGLIIGALTFIIIGVFHPIVVKSHYYWGTKPWIFFLIFGIACCVLSLFIEHTVVSPLLSVVGFTSLWTIKELFEQEERVKKGWFPDNPNRTKKK